MKRVDEILDFWINEVGPKGWYEAIDHVDSTIKRRFLEDYELASAGKLDSWKNDCRSALALLILLDQFSRNMFRGDAKSFLADPIAQDISKSALKQGFDKQISGEVSQFFMLPLMHSENLDDHKLLQEIRADRGLDPQDVHVVAHMKIIEQFGRYPFRNEVLGRETTQKEQVFMREGAYGGVVRKLREKQP